MQPSSSTIILSSYCYNYTHKCYCCYFNTGHCKALAPKYEKLAAAYAGESSVVIASVDAELEADLAQRFSVSGYPSLKLFGTGSAEPEAYNGKREVEDLVRNCISCDCRLCNCASQ
jgi:Thioredoxin